MKKIISVLAVAAFLATAGVASAANISSATFNGIDTVYGTPGSTKSATLRMEVSSGEAVRAIRVDFSNDAEPWKCVDVSDIKGEDIKDINVSVKFPLETGDDTVSFTPLYTNHQNNGFPFGCGSGDLNQGGSASADVNVVPSTNNDGDDLGNDPAPAPVVPSKCAVLAEKMAGAVRGTGQYYFGSPNGKLQAFLLDQGFNIPWLTDGSGTRYGFYGDQTASALQSFKTANSCV